MTKFGLISRASLMVGLLGGTQAVADVTAQDVWDNWKDQMDVYGEGLVIGNETMSGDTLTVDSLTMSMSDPDVSIQSEMGPITFTELGNGTVSVDFPDSYPMTIDADGMEILLTVSQSNASIIASGTPEAISYDLTADSYAITLESMGEEFANEGTIEAGELVMSDITGNYVVRTDNLQRIDYALNVGAINFNLDLRETGGDGVILAKIDMADLVAAAKIAMPLDFDPDAPETMFVNGFSMEGGYTLGSSNYAIDINVDGEAAQGTASVGQVGLEIGMDIDGIHYAGQSKDIAINAFFPNELPFPVEASLSEYALNIDVPLSQGDAPRDFAAGIALRDLAVSEGIWSMLDPTSALPHDPATVALDLTGKVNLFFDLLDPAQQQAAAMAEVPGEIHELTLNDLTVQIAGAEVLGTGAMTFDNADMQTYPGMPRPDGSVDLRINGINGLIDKLIQMGLIPEDEAMMPRMMLGMFATPVGDDQLESRIEFTPEGQILANGQRLK